MEIKIKKKSFYKYLIGVAVIIILLIFLVGVFNPVPKEKSFRIFENNSLFPSLGPDNAQTTVIEFYDFQCPWCAVASGLPSWTVDAARTNPNVAAVFNASGKMEALAENGKIKFISVSMSFLGEESTNAAEAAFCADDQGKFWEMHDAIFGANNGKENSGIFTRNNLKMIAKNVNGLNLSQFNRCLENSEKLSEIQEINKIANNFATSTPTFFVNGKKATIDEIQNLN